MVWQIMYVYVIHCMCLFQDFQIPLNVIPKVPFDPWHASIRLASWCDQLYINDCRQASGFVDSGGLHVRSNL